MHATEYCVPAAETKAKVATLMIDLVQNAPEITIEQKLDYRLEKSGSVTYIDSGNKK